MEQAISQLSVFPQTPKEIDMFVEKCVDEITSGERNPLEFEILLKNAEDTITKIRKDDRVKSCVQDEANKYSEKVFSYKGFEFSKVIKPNFDFSNDQIWCDLKKKLTERESLLKSINPSMESVADSSSGEILNPPIIKYSEYLTKKYKG